MKYLGLLLLALASLSFASDPEQYQDQQQYQGQKQSTESSASAHGGDADVDNTVRNHIDASSGDSASSAVTGDSTSSVGDVATSVDTELTVQAFGDEGDTVTVEGDTTSIDYDFPVSTAIAPSALNNSACGRTLGGAYQGQDGAGGIGLPLGNDPDCEPVSYTHLTLPTKA